MKKNLRIWAVIFWLIIWQLSSLALDNDILLVAPSDVIIRLLELTATGLFWQSVYNSFIHIVGGFLLATLTGILLAGLASRFTLVRELLSPAMLTIKAVPVASFIILALVWFSSKHLAELISFLMVLPIIYTNVLEGIGSANKELLEMAQVFRIPLYRRIRYIYIPQIMPFFIAACNLALGICWKSGIAAEVIGMPDCSIGEQLQQAKVYLNTPDLFAWTIVIVIVSLLFERLFMLLLKGTSRSLERM